MGWTTAWVSEIDPYASAVLKKNFPDAPNLGDITHIDGTQVPPVDILVGGFPCQDISAAGRGEGIEGSRSSLWSHYARLIREIKPRWVVIENSPLLRSRGLDRVLKDLDALVYDVLGDCVSARSVGAHQERDRIFIVAHSGSHGVSTGVSESQQRKARYAEIAHYCHLRADVWRSRASGLWPEPRMDRMVYGIPNRVDRVRCLGNAIVPEIAHRIFQSIERYEILTSEAHA